MKLHELKIRPEHFVDLSLGKKPYEIRLNDRNYEVGDILWLRVIDGGEYDGYEGLYRIKHILSEFEGLAKGYVALALNEVIDRSIT